MSTHGEPLAFLTAAGSQWVLKGPGTRPQARDELTKSNDDQYKDNAEFEYDRLTSMTRRIRLLRLLPGSGNSEIVCKLFEVELREGKAFLPPQNTLIEYEALSWSWGAGAKDNLILIRKEGSNQRAKASESLVWALRHLRSRSQDKFLWIDALCINQESVEEKNHQVQMMSQIYSYAQRTCIWLGREDSSSKMAINFIKYEIMHLEQFDTLCSDERNAEKWQSLLLLMQRTWFFRRWVVQEIALAQDAVVHCGPDEISWKDFSVAIELFVEVETATHRLSEVMQKDPRFYHVPGWFEYVSALGASLLVEATNMVFRYYKPNKALPSKDSDTSLEANLADPISQRRPLLSLEYLVSKLSIFQASEPRDTIYALLAIANDGYPSAEGPDEEIVKGAREILSETAEQKPFSVNYAHPYADVCQTFIEFCISRSDKSRALDILCRPWSPEPELNVSIYSHSKTPSKEMEDWFHTLDTLHKEDGGGMRHSQYWPQMKKYFPKRDTGVKLPSWIPRLSGAPFEMYHQAGIHIEKLGRKNADPLVAPPGHSRNYDAAQSTVIDQTVLQFKKRRGQQAHCMFVKGFILTEVEKTTDASQSGNIPEEWFKLAGWVTTQSEQEPNEEFWRTLVADRGKDGRNPPSYYSRACKESVFKGGLASGSVSTSDLINNERNSIITQFCRRVQAVIWNRQLIKTELGHLGIARKGVRKGDIVCILYGCSVPVILRRHVKDQTNIDEEEEEDRLFGEMEKRLQDENFLRRIIRNLKRKRRWQDRPEEVTNKQKLTSEWKFGKKEVREDLKKYKEYEKRLEEEKGKRGSNARTQEKSNATIDEVSKLGEQSGFYYEFLGECYIHGMMDGEAIREKSKRDQKHVQDRAEMDKFVSAKLASIAQPISRAPTMRDPRFNGIVHQHQDGAERPPSSDELKKQPDKEPGRKGEEKEKGGKLEDRWKKRGKEKNKEMQGKNKVEGEEKGNDNNQPGRIEGPIKSQNKVLEKASDKKDLKEPNTSATNNTAVNLAGRADPDRDPEQQPKEGWENDFLLDITFELR